MDIHTSTWYGFRKDVQTLPLTFKLRHRERINKLLTHLSTLGTNYDQWYIDNPVGVQKFKNLPNFKDISPTNEYRTKHGLIPECRYAVTDNRRTALIKTHNELRTQQQHWIADELEVPNIPPPVDSWFPKWWTDNTFLHCQICSTKTTLTNFYKAWCKTKCKGPSQP